jgi:hypothetical protein
MLGNTILLNEEDTLYETKCIYGVFSDGQFLGISAIGHNLFVGATKSLLPPQAPDTEVFF